VHDLPKQYQEEISELYVVKKTSPLPQKPLEVHKAATAFLLNWDSGSKKWKVLLINHKKIGKLIPVGGHVKNGETAGKAVLREVLEEVKSSISFFWNIQKMRWSKKPALYSIQIEKIPAFEKSPKHFHEDYMYIGYLSETAFRKIKTGVRHRLYWFYIDDIITNPKKYNIFPETLKALQKLNIIPPP